MTERNIRVESIGRSAVEDQRIEIVERKGIGHPDSICDGVAEAVARALSQAYLDRVGTVLHFNTDEAQLVAGESVPAFDGGEVHSPMYLLLVGRATTTYEGTRIPAESIARSAAREYLATTIPELDMDTDIVIDVRFGEGSGDLQQVFGEGATEVPRANDTSFGVGHAPLTETEQIVYQAERRLRTEYAVEHPAVGPDIKIMGKREDDRIDVTVAVAMIGKYISDMAAYKEAVAGVREFVAEVATEYTDREVAVHVNTADDYDEGSIYLTVTGTSAEHGDDGSVGRGNRVNGLITPNRSMSMEASSGKNPINHIGKLYNLLSTEIAKTVVAEVDGIRDLRVRLLSQIGRPIDDPHIADIQVVTEDGVSLSTIEPQIIAIVDRELADVTSVTERVLDGDISTF